MTDRCIPLPGGGTARVTGEVSPALLAALGELETAARAYAAEHPEETQAMVERQAISRRRNHDRLIRLQLHPTPCAYCADHPEETPCD